MGIEVSALCTHRLAGRQAAATRAALDLSLEHPALLGFLDLLRSQTRFASRNARFWNRQWSWEAFDEWSSQLAGPGGLEISVGSGRTASIETGVLWWQFLRVRQVRTKVDAVVTVLASALGAKELIYLPDHDLDISEARDLSDYESYPTIRTWLREEYGTPARAIGLIPCDPGDQWGGEGYFRRMLGTPLSEESLPEVEEHEMERGSEEQEVDAPRSAIASAKPMHVATFW